MLESINEYFASLKGDLLFYIIISISMILLLSFKKYMTISVITVFYSIVLVISLTIANSKITLLLFSIILFILLLYSKTKNSELKYKGNILSLSLLFNYPYNRKEDKKGIGRIVPYNKYQLPHNGKVVSLKDEYARGLMMITGSPGSGKTYGILSLIAQDLDNGKRVVYFDYKGDGKIIKDLRNIASDRDIPVYELSEYKTNFNYDPLASLNKTGKIEALLNTRKWSTDGADAHYRTATQLLIQKYIDKFEEEYDGKSRYTEAFYEFVKQQYYDKNTADAYSTLVKMLELLLTSQMKDVFLGNNEKDFRFDDEEQYIAIFSFVSSNKELANSISSFAFKDILDTGTVKEYDKELALYVDEYGTLDNSMIIKDILEKGRSCGILTTISLQDINQIVINTNQAYLNSILGIVNTFVIYSGSTKITAEMLGGVQLYDIENIMITLKKPNQKTGSSPTAMYISKYGTVDKHSSIDVFKIKPYIVHKKNKNDVFKRNKYANNKNTNLENNQTKGNIKEINNYNSNEDTLVDREETSDNMSKDDYSKFL